MKELYLLTILDGVNDFLTGLTIPCGILGGVGLFAYIMCKLIENEEHPMLKKWGYSIGLYCTYLWFGKCSCSYNSTSHDDLWCWDCCRLCSNE